MIAIGVFICRHVLFDLVSLGLDSGRPADSTIIGAMFITTGVCWLTLSLWQFPEVLAARRAAVLAITAGALLASVQPPLPKALDWMWDDAHQPISESSDAGKVK